MEGIGILMSWQALITTRNITTTLHPYKWYFKTMDDFPFGGGKGRGGWIFVWKWKAFHNVNFKMEMDKNYVEGHKVREKGRESDEGRGENSESFVIFISELFSQMWNVCSPKPFRPRGTFLLRACSDLTRNSLTMHTCIIYNFKTISCQQQKLHFTYLEKWHSFPMCLFLPICLEVPKTGHERFKLDFDYYWIVTGHYTNFYAYNNNIILAFECLFTRHC